MVAAPERDLPEEPEAVLDVMRPVPTGRVVMMFDQDADSEAKRQILASEAASTLGGPSLQIATTAQERRDARHSGQRRAALFDRLGLAVIDPAQGGGAQVAEVAARLRSASGVAMVRPEYWVYTAGVWRDSSDATWGLKATGAAESEFTGKGVKVAVLDTGFNFEHFDFSDRVIAFQDFVDENGDAADRQGHGTHCAGTVVGPRGRSGSGPNYGVAPDAELYVGKVLNDRGIGAELDIFAGIEWALDEGCHIISMSLGRPVQPGTPPDQIYERLGESALASGSLIVAAAGNDSARLSDFVAPVSIPANAKSIMAVAALNADLTIASFSNGGLNPAASGVDIAAPGVRVLSAGLSERPYIHLDGTSMATPHVAGIAALYAESDPSLRGQALWDALVASAKPLSGGTRRDFGAGLVQAPGMPIA
ncbi:S8 family serine peptidase [Fulvimarina sp. MAC8]|uniref:S8 family serine peptidase n=1 Tax=Fulvimarina sp. MAC8 TaxID=3162874 RepID=UPI0032EF910C